MKPKTSTYRESIDKVSERIDDAIVASVDYMDRNEDVNLDFILVSLAEARAYLVHARILAASADVIIHVENDQPRVYADEVAIPMADVPPKKLPKVKPQGHEKVRYKPGISKLYKSAIEFDCPTCKAEAHTFCFKYEGPGAHPKVTTERNDGNFFHRTRQDLGKAYNDRIRSQNILH